jgi:hypothetical protein
MKPNVYCIKYYKWLVQKVELESKFGVISSFFFRWKTYLDQAYFGSNPYLLDLNGSHPKNYHQWNKEDLLQVSMGREEGESDPISKMEVASQTKI